MACAFSADRALQRYGIAGDTAALRITTWSISLQYRLRDTPATNEVWTLFAKGEPTVAGGGLMSLEVWDNAGTLSLRGRFLNAAGAAEFAVSAAIEHPTDDERYTGWHAAAYTLDNGTKAAALYHAVLDAPGIVGATAYTLIDSATHAGEVPRTAGNDDMTIGAAIGAASAVTNGCTADITEVQVYSTADSKATLDARLLERVERDESNMLAYWRCDDGVDGYDTSTITDRVTYAVGAPVVGGHDMTIKNPSAHWTDGPPGLLYRSGALTAGAYGFRSIHESPGATITPTSQETAYPANRWQNGRAASVTRTADAATLHRWVLYQGSIVWPVSVLLIRNHNLTSDATITLEGHGSDAWGGPFVTENVTWHPVNIVWPLAREFECAFWRLTVDDTISGLTYYEIGQADLLTVWEPYMSARATDVTDLLDASKITETTHDVLTTRTRAKMRALRMGWEALRKDQALELKRLTRAAGTYGWATPDIRRHRGIAGSINSRPALALRGPADEYRQDGELIIMEDVA